MIAVVTLKHLVVGVAAYLVIMVDEARVDGDELPLKVAVQFIMVLDVVQDGLDAVQLLRTLRIEDDLVAFRLVVVEVLNEEVEVLVENWLGSSMKVFSWQLAVGGWIPEFYCGMSFRSKSLCSSSWCWMSFRMAWMRSSCLELSE